jgi:hypothetical protein
MDQAKMSQAGLPEHASMFSKFAQRECEIGISKPCCDICLYVLKVLQPTLHSQNCDFTLLNDNLFPVRPLDYIYECTLPPQCLEDIRHKTYNYLTDEFKYWLESDGFRTRLRLAAKDRDAAAAAECILLGQSVESSDVSQRSDDMDVSEENGYVYSDDYVAKVILQYLRDHES